MESDPRDLGSLIPSAKPLEGQEDKTSAHRLVATSMIIVFLVTAISQGWWKHVRDYIATKTHGPAVVTPPGGPSHTTGGGSGGEGGGSW